MRRVSCVLIALAAFVPSLARAQNFPDIPDNHWVSQHDHYLPQKAKDHIRFLSLLGLLDWHVEYDLMMGYPPENSSRELLRYDLVRELHVLSENIGGRYTSKTEGVKRWQKHLPVAKELVRVLREDWAKRSKGTSDPKAMKLIRERTFWLKAIQRKIQAVEEQFAAVGTPVDQHRFEDFADQPKCHWAGMAIKRMRELGIMYGYPDGTFRG